MFKAAAHRRCAAAAGCCSGGGSWHGRRQRAAPQGRAAAAGWLLLLLASAAVVSCLASPVAGAQERLPRLRWRRQALVSGEDGGGAEGGAAAAAGSTTEGGGSSPGGEGDGGGSGSSGGGGGQQLAPSTRELQRPWAEAFPEQWAAHRASLASLTVAGAPLPGHVAALLPSSERLNPAQAARGLAYVGAGARLRRVLGRLAAGGAVKAAVLGGSISFGSGIENDKGRADWFTLVVERLGTAFPGANVTGRNGCVPATPSSFMNMCGAGAG
jgi:hypothetical protein